MNANSQAAPRGRVLVIDDEVAILTTMKRILQNAGYDVQTAASAHEGLELFGQEAWDVVTVDRSMPEMNGEEVACEIKCRAPNVPIILITGFPGAVKRPALFRTIIGKPFRMDELLLCLADCLLQSGEEHRLEAVAANLQA
jgi:DNA-binding NtrC family response regulator